MAIWDDDEGKSGSDRESILDAEDGESRVCLSFTRRLEICVHAWLMMRPCAWCSSALLHGWPHMQCMQSEEAMLTCCTPRCQRVMAAGEGV